jgi:hypothetical protein
MCDADRLAFDPTSLDMTIKTKWGHRQTITLGIALLVVFCFLAYLVIARLPWWSILIQPDTRAAALADLDGDGDLDLFLANGKNEEPWYNTIWINQLGSEGGRTGKFTSSGQKIGWLEYNGVALGDVDNDGDPDALVSNTFGLSLFLNQGGKQKGQIGVFAEQESTLSGGDYWGGHHPLALGDLNGDGLFDLFAANCCGGVMFGETRELLPPHGRIWLNLSNKYQSIVQPLKLTGQPLEGQGSLGIALGDLDGDGDLDVFQANAYLSAEPVQADQHNLPDTVWLNDGQGAFQDSGQRLGQSESKSVALGDLDGDLDLDAFVGAFYGQHWVWLNAGGIQGENPGIFIDSGQRLGNSGNYNYKQSVFLGDLDKDGDLDAVVAADTAAEIWVNDGNAIFHRSIQRIVYGRKYAVTMGDLDGDGDPDLIAGYLDKDVKTWLNDGRGRFTPAR